MTKREPIPTGNPGYDRWQARMHAAIKNPPSRYRMLSRINWQSVIAAIVAAIMATLGGRYVLPSPVAPPPPPMTPPATTPPIHHPTADPVAAIGKLVMSGGTCSATVVTPPDSEGRQVLLSAAHCVRAVGETCTYYSRAGRQISCRVRAINRDADASLLITEPLTTDLPYVAVASATPAAGSKVYHAGYGIDKPGNVEEGTIVQSDTGHGQVQYRLSVSPGDSGGGICLTSAGEVLSPVCCTTQPGAVAQVYGARPEVVTRMLASPASYLDLPPMPMPPPRK